MSGRFPLFSIVIPTRNRTNLPQYALLSAAPQEFDDYEIIVTANHSEDTTGEVVRKLADGRVRYVRTNRPFSIPDSCEVAFSHVRREYVTYLCDDDAIRPLLLYKLADILSRDETEIVSWPFGAIYFHDLWDKVAEHNTLHYAVPQGRALGLKTDSVYEEVSNLSLYAPPTTVVEGAQPEH